MKKTILTLFTLFAFTNLSGNDFEIFKQYKNNSINKDNHIASDFQNNIIITGTFSNTLNFDINNSEGSELVSNGKDDIFLVKFDPNSDYIWSFSIGGNGYEEVKSIKTDNEGNIYITGTFQESIDFDPSANEVSITAESGWDVFIMKLNSFGDLLWVKNLGPYKYLKANSMSLDEDNNIYLTGYFSETIDFNPGNESYNLTASKSDDVYILKLNSYGEFVWAKSFNGTSIERGISLVVDSEQNVCLTGYFEATMFLDSNGDVKLQSKGFTDVFVIKLDKNSNVIWAKSFEGLWSSQSTGIAVDYDDNIYTTGSFKESVDFDPSNNIDTLVSIKENEDVFISKLDKNGNHLWAKMIGGTREVRSNNIATNTRGDVIITGYYESDCDFDPNEGVVTAPISNRDAMFISALNKEGYFLSASVVYGDITAKSLIVHEDYKITISTTVTDNIEFAVKGEKIISENKGDADIFLFGLNDIISNVERGLEDENLVVYPNPSNGYLNLNLDPDMNTQVEIYTQSGKLINKVENVTQDNIQVSLNGYRGVCILKITSLDNISYIKILNN